MSNILTPTLLNPSGTDKPRTNVVALRSGTASGAILRSSPTPSAEPETAPIGPATATNDRATQPTECEDTALLVGLCLWTARQYEGYLERARTANDGRPLHNYPAILVATLRRHADAGDPTCRLVLDWLCRKNLIEADVECVPCEGAA